MKRRSNVGLTELLPAIKICIVCCFLSLSACHKETRQDVVIEITPNFLGPTAYMVPFDLAAPKETETADQKFTRLANFAWQEFIALNWPSTYTESKPQRGVPDTSQTSLDFTQLGADPLVWQTYKHRVEIYPQGVTDTNTNTHTYPNYQTSFDSVPQYVYTSAPNKTIPQCGAYDPSNNSWAVIPGTSLADVHVLNNLDETSQINLATMFVDADPNEPGSAPPAGTPLWMNLPKQPRRYIYQAKANRVMFDYVVKNNYYNIKTRNDAQMRTYKAVRNEGAGGNSTCPVTATGQEQVCFPHGSNNQGGTEGTILIKATWRQLTLAEYNSGRYLSREILRYRNSKPEAQLLPGEAIPYCYEIIPATPTATTLPYGLTGLHIIHKTENFPTYVFATFEQVDNLDQSKPNNQLFYYNRNAGLVNPDKQVVTKRAHPIPAAINAVTQEVHQQIRTLLKQNGLDDSVWLYYKLIGVQGEAVDAGINEDYFLANIVTETNEVLRSFSGTLDNSNGTIDPTQLNMFAFDANSSPPANHSFIGGGCKGCHGNAQVGPAPDTGSAQRASDFSFITQNAPFGGVPDAINQPLLKSEDP